MISLALVAFAFGLIIGSFLNVCIYRLPRELSIVSPRSACPACSTPIRPYDNIPILSYMFLAGKCRKCGERISIRYPLVELLNGLAYVAVLVHFGLGWHLPFLFAFVSAMILITFVDLDFQIIPNVITLPGIAIGVVGAALFIPDPFGNLCGPRVGIVNSLIGAVTGFSLFYLIAVIGKAAAKTDAMGGGDLKMMAMVGAFTGWKAIILTTFVGSLVGSAVGIFLIVARGEGRKTVIPFGPFLAVGALTSLFFGGMLMRWYFKLSGS